MAIAKSYTLYKANTQNLEMTGVADGDTGIMATSATITFNLYDPAGVIVPNAGPITLAYTGTPGSFTGILPSTFDPPVAGGYVIKLDLSLGAHLEIPAVVKVRAA